MGAYENWTDLQAVIDVVAAQTLLPADGLSETMVTAVVMGEDGTPVPDTAVIWSLDVGALLCCDSATNAVGEATATIQSAQCHETATVTARAEAVSAAGYAWVQYGSPQDPRAFPISVSMNQTLTGSVEVDYWVGDSNGGISNLEDVEVYVDGQCVAEPEVNDAVYYWDTDGLPNGLHSIDVCVTDISGNTMHSPVTPVYTGNLVNSVGSSLDEIDPSQSQCTSIQAMLAQPCNWQLTIRDSSEDTTVYTTSGGGSQVSATWDGSELRGR